MVEMNVLVENIRGRECASLPVLNAAFEPGDDSAGARFSGHDKGE